jgi:hypothetical protein
VQLARGGRLGEVEREEVDVDAETASATAATTRPLPWGAASDGSACATLVATLRRPYRPG